ncbi:unnamed protein product [Camellia sinensis]
MSSSVAVTLYDVLPSLEEQGVRQLYPKRPNIDFKNELRTLNRELQLHILELADVLIERPSQYARRARATLIHMLELRIQRRKEAMEDIKRDPSASLDDVLGWYC